MANWHREWPIETITRLRELWSEGLSTAEIGRRLGVSKNAVVGKAHRLDLPARPSPIRRDGEGGVPRAPTPRRVRGSTLPPLSDASLEPKVATLPPRPSMVLTPRPEAPLVPKLLPVQAVQPPPPIPEPRPYGRVIACCWPIGEPGTRSFRFCDAESAPGKPYCAGHAQLAYAKVRVRDHEAA